MRKLLVVGLIALLSGCASVTSSGTGNPPHKLGKEWSPLEEIRERPALVQDAAGEGVITTVGKFCYVKDINTWLARNPVDSPKFKAILRHEQEHSKRQHDTGVATWIARYGVDKSFALLEEQIGYYYEITEKRRLGIRFDPKAFARIFSRYKNLAGSLISYEDALEWTESVLDGSWAPPN